jgi:hypothetical protein
LELGEGVMLTDSMVAKRTIVNRKRYPKREYYESPGRTKLPPWPELEALAFKNMVPHLDRWIIASGQGITDCIRKVKYEKSNRVRRCYVCFPIDFDTNTYLAVHKNTGESWAVVCPEKTEEMMWKVTMSSRLTTIRNEVMEDFEARTSLACFWFISRLAMKRLPLVQYLDQGPYTFPYYRSYLFYACRSIFHNSASAFYLEFKKFTKKKATPRGYYINDLVLANYASLEVGRMEVMETLSYWDLGKTLEEL